VSVVYCVGTATEVGKTWVGGAVLTELRRRGRTVAACKPVQSFDPGGDGPLDAEVLAAATGQHPDEVCPPARTYGAAMAPPMAAAALGRPCPTLAELLPTATTELLWVEGVGGPRSPIAADGDGIDLCAALAPDLVVLVADAGLGTINAVVLSIEPLRGLGQEPVVVLNRYDDADDLHRRNRAWLVERLGIDVVTSPSAVADRI
jgi:dethiobiotin synthetase